ncbi:MAG: TRAP transporter permease [Smithellaceae bacterium]|nr:TRAP transporter permease [Smithellaceae bacterium]
MTADKTVLDNSREIAKAEELVKKYDTESRFRNLTGWRGQIVTLWLIAMSLFHLYAASVGTLTTNIQRTWHLLFAMVAVFLLYPSRAKEAQKDKFSWLDLLLALAAVIVNGYLILFFDQIVMRGAKVTPVEFVLGLIAIIILLEAGRRVLGWGLPILAAIFLLYCYYGRYAPGLFQHRGYPLERIIQHMYVVPEGIYGVALGVSATFVFLFILFGAFLNTSGGAKLFNDLAMATAGRMGGGPAKVAIFASGLLGTINGSSIANTATTGAFTIPLMKKVGYKPHFAGAVEATASTGGQIMPPVMGAAAFIMTEFLSVPYTTIMKAAMLPAILYFFSVFMSVHFTAKKDNLQALPREMIPDARKVFKSMGHLFLPLVLVIALLIIGYTPVFAAFWGTVSVFAVSWLRKETRMNIPKLLAALRDGARGALGVAIACALVGFIIGASSLTGLGLMVSNNFMELAGGMLLPALIFAMIACLILGMGLPTTANYIVTATIIAPALVKMGVMPIAAHFFVFYFGIMADITPPVCLAAFTGAGIAGASPMRTGITATTLALAAFILPYMFVYNPQLLLQGVHFFEFLPLLATALVGIIALAAGTMNYLLTDDTIPERIVLIGGGVCMIYPGWTTDLIGFSALTLVIILQFVRKKRLAGGVVLVDKG